MVGCGQQITYCTPLKLTRYPHPTNHQPQTTNHSPNKYNYFFFLQPNSLITKMKKFIYLLLLLVAVPALVSCSDDDGNDLPNVDFDLSFENAVEIEGELYIVKGENLVISGIDVINKESGKGAMITNASYYWDGYYMGSNVQPPFAFEYVIGENVPVGKHQIEISCPVYAVDKAPARAIVYFYVNVVSSAEEVPSQPSEGATTVHPHILADTSSAD